MILKKYTAFFFMVFFILTISAPAIIISIDNSADVSMLLGLNEDEEKEDIKLLFDVNSQDMDHYFQDDIHLDNMTYNCKKYLKPHLNLVFPPPEKI